MAKSRDGLVPVRRVDKNGHLTTKYVRPEGSAPRKAAAVPPPSARPPATRPESQHVADSDDPRVQEGQVLDRIVHRGTLYSRAREGVTPGVFQTLRIQLNRPLEEVGASAITSIIDATARSHFGLPPGSRTSVVDIDSDYSLILRTDTWAAPVRNFARSARIMHRALPQKLAEGTAAIPDSDRGPGLPAFPGLGDDFSFEVYYDAVEGDPATDLVAERGTADAEVIEASLSSEAKALSSGIL